MAEIGGSPNEVGFTQDMESKPMKAAADSRMGEGRSQTEHLRPESKSTENGGEIPEQQQQHNSGMPLLRPSAFKPSPVTTSGILAPSRLGYPFAPKLPTDSSSSDGAHGGDLPLSKNPFARPGNSALNDEGNQNSSRFTLRPSALDRHTANFSQPKDSDSTYRSSFKLEPAKIQSPFCKANGAGSEQLSPVGGDNGEEADPPESALHSCHSDEVKQRLFGSQNDNKQEQNLISTSNSADSTDQGVIFGKKLNERVQESSQSVVSSSTDIPGQSGGFIFGQNLSDRVVNTPHKDREKGEAGDASLSSSTDDTSQPEPDDGQKAATLEESAAQYEASKVRPELAAVEVKTGEEEESNVFQINVKLFIFDKSTQTWIERGRGLLRLNDMSDDDRAAFQSRLVMRTQGSLRVVLNTKIWPGMIIDRASEKGVRISAMDTDTDAVKIFLIMASPKDCDQIFTAIDSRVQQLRVNESQCSRVEDEESRESYYTSQPEDSQHSDIASCGKRQSEASEDGTLGKKRRVDQRRDTITEESNDSSTVDPETEASNESYTSSPTMKSSSSDA